MRNEYSTLDIVKALDIPRERLRDWMNKGFVKPTKPAEGQGTKAIFTRYDVYNVELFRKLIAFGLNRKDAAALSQDETPNIVQGDIGRYWNEILYVVIHFMDEFDFAVGSTATVKKEELVHPASGSAILIDEKGVAQKEFFKKESIRKSRKDFHSEDMDQILIVNIEKIRRKVDMALSEFD